VSNKDEKYVKQKADRTIFFIRLSANPLKPLDRGAFNCELFVNFMILYKFFMLMIYDKISRKQITG
jgi:hypothetical protein